MTKATSSIPFSVWRKIAMATVASQERPDDRRTVELVEGR
jgi:hypothetical protein